MNSLYEVRERAETYGLTALNDGEIITLMKGKDNDLDAFFRSKQGKILLHAVDRWKSNNTCKQVKKIQSSHHVFEALSEIRNADQEQFWIIFGGRNYAIKGKKLISVGNATATVVDVQNILKTLLDNRAQFVVCAHNHPSGNLKPSQEDITITKRIKDACRLLEIHLTDHVIFGNAETEGYYSFADEGIL